MGKLLTFFFLAEILGSPWRALLAVLVLYWLLDRSTLRVLPGPWKLFRRGMERRRLARVLADNPHDFRSELELGRLLIESKRWRAAKEHLDRAAGAYTTDASVQSWRAVARIGAGERDDGVAEIESLMAANPRLRFGEPWLEAGELLLAGGDVARGKAMIGKYLEMHPSSVKGLFLMAKAQAKSGDAAGARDSRRRAWNEYATNPAFKRKNDRMWAYRANPLRPAMYAGGIFAVLGMVSVLLEIRH